MSAPRPLVVPPQPWTFPVPRELRLPGGIRALVHDLPGQYVLSMRVVVPSPLAAEPQGLEGIGSMTARMLDEGTTTHDAEELVELMERHGMALGAGVSDGGLLVDVDVPARHLGTAVEVVTEVLTSPTFPETEVRRVLRNRLAQIEQERASSAHRAARELARTMWHGDDRASRPSAGTTESVSAMTRDDLVAHHASAIGPSGATVVLAGDLTGLDVDDVLGTALAGWSAPDHRP
ncbi:MAG: insulinase family protein, partial [Ornithinibacter sp.]